MMRKRQVGGMKALRWILLGVKMQTVEALEAQGKDPKTFQENSQGKDPRTLKRDSHGKGPSTFEENSQGKDSSTFEGRSHQAERWRIQEKWKEEKRRKREKKTVKHRNRKWWKKCKELIISLHLMRMKKGRKEKENKRSERLSKARQTLWKFGKWLFLLLILGQNWLSVSAAAEGAQRRTEAVMRMQQEVQIKESRWNERAHKRWKQPKGKDKIEKKNEARVLSEVHFAQWIGFVVRRKST